MALTEAQIEALEETYTTLRSLQNTYGREDATIGNYCAQAVSMLVDAFPYLAALEAEMEKQERE